MMQLVFTLVKSETDEAGPYILPAGAEDSIAAAVLIELINGQRGDISRFINAEAARATVLSHVRGRFLPGDAARGSFTSYLHPHPRSPSYRLVYGWWVDRFCRMHWNISVKPVTRIDGQEDWGSVFGKVNGPKAIACAFPHFVTVPGDKTYATLDGNCRRMFDLIEEYPDEIDTRGALADCLEEQVGMPDLQRRVWVKGQREIFNMLCRLEQPGEMNVGGEDDAEAAEAGAVPATA